MKQVAVFLTLCLPLSVFAENMQGMSEEQMQQMMQQAQGMQTCMQNVDQAEMQAFEQRAEQMTAETKALCASGKRDEAMKVAIAFGKEVASNKAVQEMKKCGDMVKGMLPKAIPQDNGQSSPDSHICDMQ
jgi:alanyl-tRNA synthetase